MGVQGLNVLMVAPEHPDLPNVASEVAAVSNQHNVVRLVGTVRDGDVARAIQEGPYDVLWFATHGGPEGILLSDGPLSVAGVGQYVRTSGAALCVLNTCDSEEAALSIIAGAPADMICTIAAVDDQDAARLGILFAGELARSSDFYEAYLRVRPEGGKYRYYRAGPMAPMLRRYPGDADVLRQIYERLARIETKLEDLPRVHLEISKLEEEIAQVRAMPLSVRVAVLAVAVVVGVMLGTFLSNFV